jgi:NAD+ diphosphatase
MIQDILPHRINNHYQPNTTIGEKDFILHYKDDSLLLKTNGEAFEIPQKKDFPEISDKTEGIFLFSLNDIPCFLIWDDLMADKSRFIYKEVNFFHTFRQPEIAWICILGFKLMNWYSQNKFCGKCGKRTKHKTDERAIICSDCNTIVFPKISPAIMAAITCNNKILLARNINFTGNWYSLLAGYVDVGETLEETLIREVKEEVGVDIKNIRYYKSQPWPPSGSLMIAFVAEADENQPITIDNKEIAEAAWFTRGSLPNHSSNISIAGEMIEKFERGEL